MATEPFIGTLTTFGGTFTIANWAQCLGQLQAISQNTALFSLLGTIYNGDGRTTFGLPDLRGRSPVGQGLRPGGYNYRQGIMMGFEEVTLQIKQMPSHTHNAIFTPTGSAGVTASLDVATDEGTTKTPTDSSYLAAGSSSNNYFTPGLAPATLTEIQGLNVAGGGGTGIVTVDETGGSTPVPVLNPILPLNWLIALQGLYPQRS